MIRKLKFVGKNNIFSCKSLKNKDYILSIKDKIYIKNYILKFFNDKIKCKIIYKLKKLNKNYKLVII